MAFLSAIHVWTGQVPRVQLSGPPAHVAPGFKLETLKPPGPVNAVTSVRLPRLTHASHPRQHRAPSLAIRYLQPQTARKFAFSRTPNSSVREGGSQWAEHLARPPRKWAGHSGIHNRSLHLPVGLQRPVLAL